MGLPRIWQFIGLREFRKSLLRAICIFVPLLEGPLSKGCRNALLQYVAVLRRLLLLLQSSFSLTVVLRFLLHDSFGLLSLSVILRLLLHDSFGLPSLSVVLRVLLVACLLLVVVEPLHIGGLSVLL